MSKMPYRWIKLYYKKNGDAKGIKGEGEILNFSPIFHLNSPIYCPRFIIIYTPNVKFSSLKNQASLPITTKSREKNIYRNNSTTVTVTQQQVAEIRFVVSKLKQRKRKGYLNSKNSICRRFAFYRWRRLRGSGRALEIKRGFAAKVRLCLYDM